MGAEAAHLVWRLLTSVRAAIIAVLLLGGAALLGVLVPQAPAGVRDQPDVMAAWVELQRGDFGPFTTAFHRLGLFDVFHSWWFLGLLAWMAAAVAACSYSRLPGLWRQAFRPPRRIPSELYERSAAVEVISGTSPEAAERELRRRRFKTWRVNEGEITYLFADRFAWASLATVLTHLALILFLVGALVTKLDAFGTSLTIAEGATAPVFPVSHENQIQVGVLDAVGSFDDRGRPLDYRSNLVLYSNGEEVKRCTITVNSPCGLGSYRIHQSGFFGFGAELHVRDLDTGNAVYQEVLALNRPLPSPRLTITTADGAAIFEGPVPQTNLVEGSLGSLLRIPETDKVIWVELREGDSDWTLVVFDPSRDDEDDRAFIPLGESDSVSGLQFDFSGVTGLPSLLAGGIPLPVANPDPDDDGLVMLALENAVFGTSDAAAGDERPGGSASASPVLDIVGIAPSTVRLGEGDRAQIGPYEYEFVGSRNFAGIGVRRDRGDTVIWAATALFLIGLAITLWIPRQRAWLRFKRGEMRMVSQGRGRLDASTLGDEQR
jgi:cytochrome c biogenesis protein ResB